MSEAPFGFGPEPSSAMAMSLRDYAAIKAMAGWLSTYTGEYSHPANGLEVDGYNASAKQRLEDISRWSYAMADAMLKAREVTK